MALNLKLLRHRSTNHTKKISRSGWGNLLVLVFLLLLAAFSILPFIFAILQSFKPLDEIFIFPPRFFVNRPSLENYYLLSQLTKNMWVPFSRYSFNSVFVSITATVLHVVFASMCAYPLAKFKIPGSKMIFNVIVLSLLFTGEVTAIPSFILMSRTGMINNYLALILPPVASSLGLFLMKQFIEQMPDSIIEAARVDGSGNFRTLFSVVMPSVRPAWLTLIIFSFQGVWNREGLEFIYNEELKMLPTVLRQITSSGIARSGAAAAAAVLLMIPPITIFILSQSNIIETMAHSGIKE
ncbi:MAG: carbohydrate ABC transporter permease [Eubacteriales bacterium]|nr:carbohydrate ABC transporter permease [Eubacteriales bacterium]MDD4327236.1 carbohydrate ABC transporter permease [Eubacteriales bacterium]MDD4717772.1 carbohydrate ABC transporter permease [Eubacteriales bacterium]